MSTVVCQGLQPYLDQSHLVETTTMRLKVVTPKSLGLARGLSMADNEINKEVVKEKCQNNDGWNFLQSLSSSPQTPKKETSYIHPLVKKSSMLMLSEKSLELCTESLGSETGSDTISSESSILSLSLFDSRNYISTKSLPIPIPTPMEERSSNSIRQMESRKAMISPRSFPPPLTTISGSNSLQVRPHREGGRLIIQAMEAPSTHSYFQTERSHGRLRLSLWENVVDTEEEREEINEEDEVLDVQNDMIGDDGDDQEKEGGNDGEIDVKNSDKDGINNYDVEVGIGMGMGVGVRMEKFQRGKAATSRCKEDGHRIGGDKGGLGCSTNWEAFLVAT